MQTLFPEPVAPAISKWALRQYQQPQAFRQYPSHGKSSLTDDFEILPTQSLHGAKPV